MRFLEKLLKGFADFLFPKKPKVVVLESLSTAELLRLLPRAEGPKQNDVIALFDYAHPMVKEIVWEVKYGGNRALAAKAGEILCDTIIEELEERNILNTGEKILLIPSPISGKRRFERGWNQAEILCEAIKKCDAGGIFKYLPGQLIKIVHTESQTKTASKKERLENLEGSMKVQNPLSVENQFIVLVDDVTTTGATFAEARRALRETGAKKVLCFALAH